MSKNQMEKSFEKKTSIKFCSRMTIGPMGQEFWPEYNFGAFVQKLVHSIFRGLMEKSFVRKQILLNFV